MEEIKELDGLSPEERETVLKILEQYSKTGKSELYNELTYKDFKEIPVDIITFLKDYNYLGKAWHSEDGTFKLFPFWEEKLKELFPTPFKVNYNNFIETGARGLGKAQPLYSKVLTSAGFKQMGDLRLGDSVYGEDGKLHSVIGIFPQGKKPVYEVEFSDHSKTRCSDEHLWTVKKQYSHKRLKTMTLKEIMDKGLYKEVSGKKAYKFAIPLCSPIEFENKDVFIDPYLLGCLIGDGCISGRMLKLTTSDDEIVEFVSKIVAKEGYDLNQYAGKFEYGISRERGLGQNRYREELNLLGLSCTSETKFIPTIYLQNSVEKRIALLQGLMDTDGYCSKEGYCQFSTVSERLRDDFIFLVQSLGGTAATCVKHPEYTDKDGEKIEGKTCYEIIVSLPKDIIPFRLTRKVNRLSDKKHPPVRTLKKITYIGEEECQCILLDSETHLYLTDDLIVTHNSELAVTCILYMMHVIMCLKNPHSYYNLKPTEKIAFAFMNITKKLAEDIGISKFQNTVQMSPWFLSRGTITQRDNQPYWNPPDYINIIVGSQSSHVIGQPILAAFFDEISFVRNKDVDEQKKIAIDMIDTAIGGMKTRFINRGQNPTLLILASSKRSEHSFLEEHTRKKIADHSASVLVVDEAVWNVHPAEEYSGVKFQVGVGNKFLTSEIIPDGANLDEWRKKGYKIIDVPEEFKEDFVKNIDKALCDFAGISSSELTKYISGPRLANTKDYSLKNLFIKDLIKVGNAVDDTVQYYDFIDLNNVPAKMKDKPLYIHLDMSISGDKTGIAGVWIKGKRRSSENNATEMCYQLAFSVSVEAPKGYQVSFAKNRQFIYWLKEQGFNIKGISTDTFQNAALAQDFISKGYNYEVISVDRVGSDHICAPYAFLKNSIYECRIALYESELLTEELLGLERNGITGKIDHPNYGRVGSKDAADALCAALWNASKHADEFVFEFGEELDDVITANNATTSDANYIKQFSTDFENELNRTFGNQPTLIRNSCDFMDFGMGKATEDYKLNYLRQGIIII